jgi:hypothetical protein
MSVYRRRQNRRYLPGGRPQSKGPSTLVYSWPKFAGMAGDYSWVVSRQAFGFLRLLVDSA